ncbi:MAG: ArnT family glycosyltransferase [Pseudomonadota bacterium]
MTLESRLDQWSRGWRGPALAALVALIAGLPGLLAAPPLDRDESRFAQATAQMLESGDFISINYQDRPREKKPVGIHWLQAASVAIVSDAADRDIRAFRIPSLLGAMLAAAACAWGAAAFFGPRAGLLAGAMLGASFLLSTEAAIAKTDAVLAGTTTLALAAMGRIYAAARDGPPAGRRVRLLFWLAIGLAALVKGPVGPMVALLTGLSLWIVDGPAPWREGLRRWATAPRPAWIGRLGWSWGPLLALLIVGPWSLAITVATDGAFWGSAVGGDLAPKLIGGHERHGGPPGYHLLLAPLLVFPASLLLPAALVQIARAWRKPGIRFAACWLVPAWLVFELLPTKLAHYTLPTVAALTWLMAAALRAPLGRALRWAGAASLAYAALGLSAACVYALTAFGDGGDVTWGAVAIGLFLATAFVGGYLLVGRAAGVALVAAGVLGVLAHAVVLGQLLPRLEPLWLSERVALALARTGLAPREGVTPGPVEVAGYAEPSLVFTLGSETGLGGPAEAAAAVAEGRPAVVEAREEPEFLARLARAGLPARPAATISGFDYSNGEDMRLTLYRGEPQVPPAREPAP